MEEKKKKPIYKKWWFWILAVFVLLVIVSTGNSDTTQTSSNTANEAKIEVNNVETEEEKAKRLEQEKVEKEQQESSFKAECKTYTFEELARNPENIKGQKVKLTGEVIQTSESSRNKSVDLRINITKSEYGLYSDTIYAIYTLPDGADKILEDDIITIWGTAEGDYSYTSVLGSKVTLPKINVSYIEIQK